MYIFIMGYVQEDDETEGKPKYYYILVNCPEQKGTRTYATFDNTGDNNYWSFKEQSQATCITDLMCCSYTISVVEIRKNA